MLAVLYYNVSELDYFSGPFAKTWRGATETQPRPRQRPSALERGNGGEGHRVNGASGGEAGGC